MAVTVLVYKGELTASMFINGMTVPCDLEDVDEKLLQRGYVRKWRKKEGKTVTEEWRKEDKDG